MNDHSRGVNRHSRNAERRPWGRRSFQLVVPETRRYSRSFTPSRYSSSSLWVASILARLKSLTLRPCTIVYSPFLQVTG